MSSSFDPSKPSLPVSYPIDDLADLASGAYYRSFHYPFNVAAVPLPPSASRLPDRRRVLVCHDMMGGYADDRWVQGGNNADAYSIWHWYLMDIFVYFSHSLVTVPPPCWTNAAHAHGVKVLGTFITERDKGSETCRTLLATRESAVMYADKLVELASHLGFDGWLLNMEVKLNEQQVHILKEFVSHLTKAMHTADPGSLIIWYDSVTDDGQLNWQDQLNEKNKPFFDLCDGIFVNYFWKEDGPITSASNAGSRKYDVYMGVDVFGRGTYGGGGWKTNIALDLLKKDDISAAIFAPGWVYENLPKDDFESNQNCWWGLVKQSWGILQSYPKMLPFDSNFDQGRGLHFFIKGLQVAEDPWNNIACEGVQPLLEEPLSLEECPMEHNMQVFFNFEDESYSGGGSITCKGSFSENNSFMTRLFQGQLLLEDLPLIFSYSVKSEGSSQMGLLLVLTSDTREPCSILVADAAAAHKDKLTKRYGNVEYMQVKKTRIDGSTGSPWILHESDIAKSGYTITDIYLYCYMDDQESNTQKPDKIYPYFASLGHISIRLSSENTQFPPADSWSIQFQDISQGSSANGAPAVSLTIIWELKEEITASFTKYNIYVDKVGDPVDANSGSALASRETFLGVARVGRFYASDVEVPAGVSGLKFMVQPNGPAGDCPELGDCPALVFVP